MSLEFLHSQEVRLTQEEARALFEAAGDILEGFVIDGWPDFLVDALETGANKLRDLATKSHIYRVRVPCRPRIVCLCGSIRFIEMFKQANLELTLQGKIVLSIGCAGKSDADLFGSLSEREWQETKEKLDILHKRKIDLADEIFVLNVNGYIGESTASEIAYAIARGKEVRYLQGKGDEHGTHDAKASQGEM